MSDCDAGATAADVCCALRLYGPWCPAEQWQKPCASVTVTNAATCALWRAVGYSTGHGRHNLMVQNPSVVLHCSTAAAVQASTCGM